MTCLELSTIYCFLPCSSAEKAQAPGSEESDLRSADDWYTYSRRCCCWCSRYRINDPSFPSYISDLGRHIPAHENGGNTMKLHRTRPNIVKIMFYCMWNLFLITTRMVIRFANIMIIDRFWLKWLNFGNLPTFPISPLITKWHFLPTKQF